MKIKSYETYVLGTPWRNLTYVFIELEDGTRGVGEARVLSKALEGCFLHLEDGCIEDQVAERKFSEITQCCGQVQVLQFRLGNTNSQRESAHVTSKTPHRLA